MRVVIQRVDEASVTVNNEYTNSINKGYMILLGICTTDTLDDLNYLISKIEKLRIFEDENGKMNLSIKDVNGEILFDDAALIISTKVFSLLLAITLTLASYLLLTFSFHITSITLSSCNIFLQSL